MPSNFNQYQPFTGFNTTDPNTNATQDLGQRYTTKSYLLDVYPNLVPNRTAPGMWVCGNAASANFYGYQGLNIAPPGTGVTTPTQIGTLTTWKQVNDGSTYSTGAIRNDGTLWLWGLNTYGQLGQSSLVHRSSPTQVGLLTSWKQVAASWYFTAAIQTDGTLWTWGYNAQGQLGAGNTTARSSPVKVGALTDWKYVSNSQNLFMAIKSDGSLWGCGYNTFGSIGQSNQTGYSSPIRVGLGTNWKSVICLDSSVLAIQTNGTLWAWGNNTGGQLGLGDLTPRSSPTQVGSMTDWKTLSKGAGVYSNTSVGCIKTDGTLWTWGANGLGQLGLGDLTHRSSPVKVGSLTNWKQALVCNGLCVGIKTDGTLWNWGVTFTNTYSSPIQVGTDMSWKSIGGTGDNYFAIRDGYF